MEATLAGHDISAYAARLEERIKKLELREAEDRTIDDQRVAGIDHEDAQLEELTSMLEQRLSLLDGDRVEELQASMRSLGFRLERLVDANGKAKSSSRRGSCRSVESEELAPGKTPSDVFGSISSDLWRTVERRKSNSESKAVGRQDGGFPQMPMPVPQPMLMGRLDSGIRESGIHSSPAVLWKKESIGESASLLGPAIEQVKQGVHSSALLVKDFAERLALAEERRREAEQQMEVALSRAEQMDKYCQNLSDRLLEVEKQASAPSSPANAQGGHLGLADSEASSGRPDASPAGLQPLHEVNEAQQPRFDTIPSDKTTLPGDIEDVLKQEAEEASDRADTLKQQLQQLQQLQLQQQLQHSETCHRLQNELNERMVQNEALQQRLDVTQLSGLEQKCGQKDEEIKQLRSEISKERAADAKVADGLKAQLAKLEVVARKVPDLEQTVQEQAAQLTQLQFLQVPDLERTLREQATQITQLQGEAALYAMKEQQARATDQTHIEEANTKACEAESRRKDSISSLEQRLQDEAEQGVVAAESHKARRAADEEERRALELRLRSSEADRERLMKDLESRRASEQRSAASPKASPPVSPVREQSVARRAQDTVLIERLSQEKDALSDQLAQLWARITQQAQKIEQERLSFWEELNQRSQQSAIEAPSVVQSATAQAPVRNMNGGVGGLVASLTNLTPSSMSPSATSMRMVSSPPRQLTQPAPWETTTQLRPSPSLETTTQLRSAGAPNVPIIVGPTVSARSSQPQSRFPLKDSTKYLSPSMSAPSPGLVSPRAHRISDPPVPVPLVATAPRPLPLQRRPPAVPSSIQAATAAGTTQKSYEAFRQVLASSTKMGL